MAKVQLSIDKRFPDIYPGSWAIPQELAERVSKTHKRLRIGIPKENHFQENRIPVTPDTVGVLVNNGHQVFIEHDAGIGSRFADKDFADAGAVITYNRADLFKQSDYIIKISPISPDEMELLRENQKVISAVHLGSLTPTYLQGLMKKNITAIGFEFYRSEDGSFPLVQMMSEIAGVCSIHIASELLTVYKGGQGLLLGGITGIPPAEVAILGAGTVGFNAAQTAMGMGARVRIIDEELYKLRRIERELGLNIYTSIAQGNFIREAVREADVVIGAIYRQGSRTPLIVTEDMVKEMKEGSVIIDVSIDQGGCIETSKLTTHDDPTFIKEGIIHYCVPNIASRVSRTASQAISNIIGPLLVKIGDHGGIDNYIKYNDGLKYGVYIYHRHLTKKYLADLFNMNRQYRDIELLIVSF